MLAGLLVHIGIRQSACQGTFLCQDDGKTGQDGRSDDKNAGTFGLPDLLAPASKARRAHSVLFRSFYAERDKKSV